MRISVLALVFAGMAASFSTPSSASTQSYIAKVSSGPIPVCEPDGSTDCNIGGRGGRNGKGGKKGQGGRR
jgi:hypothetical protein